MPANDEADHGRLKASLRPMRGLKQLRSARIIAAGHAFIQNPRRGHYDVVADEPPLARVRTAFDQVALCIGAGFRPPSPQVKIIPR